MKKILFLTKREHHFANDFAADSVGAKFYYFPNFFIFNKLGLSNIAYFIYSFFIGPFIIPKADVYIVCSENNLLALRMKYLFKKKDAKVIHYVKSDYYSTNHKGFKRKLLNVLAKIADGAVLVGGTLEKEIRDNKLKFPVEVAYSVSTEDFTPIKPALSKKAVFVTGIQPRLRKGTDIIYEVAKQNRDVEFYILGNPNVLPKKLHEDCKKQKNLHLVGYQDQKEYMKKCSVFMLPSRYDSGPTVVLDAMQAGNVPIISSACGVSPIVAKIEPSLVIDTFDAKKYSKELQRVLKLSLKQRKTLSDKLKKEGKNYVAKDKKDMRFKKSFDKLLKRLDK